jgi:hypothetical protein
VGVHFVLPALDGGAKVVVGPPKALSPRLLAPHPDDFDRAAHPHPEHRQTSQACSAIAKDPERAGVGVVVVDVGYDVQAVAAVSALA